MSSARHRPKRPLPDLGDLPPQGRHAVRAIIAHNRRQLKRGGRLVGDDAWTAGFLEGLYVAGGLRSRADVNSAARTIRRDVVETLVE